MPRGGGRQRSILIALFVFFFCWEIMENVGSFNEVTKSYQNMKYYKIVFLASFHGLSPVQILDIFTSVEVLRS